MRSIGNLALSFVHNANTPGNADKSGSAIDSKTVRNTCSQIHAKRDRSFSDCSGRDCIADIHQLILTVERYFPRASSVLCPRFFGNA